MEKVDRQSAVLISLLARATLGVDAIQAIVAKGKRDPQAYIRVYNSLGGDLGVSEAAKMARVSKGTMSSTLTSWEEQGIVYDIGDRSRPAYVAMLKLPKKARRIEAE